MAISKCFLLAVLFFMAISLVESVPKGCGYRPCHHYAQCVRVGYSYAFKCKCNTGYVGNGYSCRRSNPCYPSPCHKYAKCSVFHYQAKCTCYYGYKGDGKTCKRDQCYGNRCNKNAYCQPKSNGYHGYDCTCKSGYHGNGYYCKYDKCYQNKCHKFAKCYPRIFGYGYVCRCQRGYWGNGYHCIKPHYQPRHYVPNKKKPWGF